MSEEFTIRHDEHGVVYLFSDVIDLKTDSSRKLYMKKHDGLETGFQDSTIVRPSGMNRLEKQEYLIEAYQHFKNVLSSNPEQFEDEGGEKEWDGEDDLF